MSNYVQHEHVANIIQVNVFIDNNSLYEGNSKISML